MCSSIYIGALKAASLMCEALGEDGSVYKELYEKGRAYMEVELFNGEYFEQRTTWEGLRAELPSLGHDAGNVQYSEDAYEIFKREGPKYQYGTGCLADGLLGAWLAAVCGLGDILDPEKVKKLKSGQEVFERVASLVWKKTQVVRFYDARRNVLVYLTYTDRVIEGSPRNSISVVPLGRPQ